VLLAGIGAVAGQSTVNWNHGDLKVNVDQGGRYDLMMQITNCNGDKQDAITMPVVLKAGENIVKIGSKTVEHIADGKAPLQHALFWLQIDGTQVSNALVMPQH